MSQEPNPYGEELTPKQQENWQNHGLPVYQAIAEVVPRMRRNASEDREALKNLTVDEVQDYYVRTYRPKKRGDGMMERDGSKMSEDRDLHYIKKVLEDWFNPWGSFQGLIMASLMASDTDKLDAVGNAIALAKISLMSENRKKQLLRENVEVARLYGAA